MCVAGGVNMLITVDEINGIKENKSFHSLGKELFFSSANGDARSVLSDSLEAPLKAAGS